MKTITSSAGGRGLAITLRLAFRWLLLLTAGSIWMSSARVEAAQPRSLAPVGETKPFHGTLRAQDLRLGTLSLGSSQKITRVLALDSSSRLVKGFHPASLADFAVGDVIEGFAYPDEYGRMVVAVATATAKPLTAGETRAVSGRKSKATGRQRGRSRQAPSVVPAPGGPQPGPTVVPPPAAPSPRAVPRRDSPAAVRSRCPSVRRPRPGDRGNERSCRVFGGDSFLIKSPIG